ncbi:MAG: hypothetical protein HY796_01655 [Elusimicrobia bacterium]|nr:hypothetical protein [Elusimicrobiota bacterium]
MQMSKYALSACLIFLVSAPAFSQEDYNPQEVNPFLDPALQDYVETVYGYRNPANAPKFASDFRDTLTSLSVAALKSALAGRRPGGSASQPSIRPAAPLPQPSALSPQPSSFPQDRLPNVLNSIGESHGSGGSLAVPGQYYKVTFANENGPLSAFVAPLAPDALSGFKAGEYVFISILPATADHARLIDALSKTGFKFSGEKTYFTDSGKKTFLLGWAPYANLPAICGQQGVRKVAVEKKTSGVPLKTRIRFTLRAPSGERSDAFVSDFLKNLNTRTGFASENVLRLPQNSAHAKFTAFDVTGSLPVDMIGELSQSPFVAAIEFKDNAL